MQADSRFIRANTAYTADKMVIEANEICAQFGPRVVLDKIDLAVSRGEILAIVGGSGSGKSTLMRQLAMLSTPTSGAIKIFGVNMSTLDEADSISVRQRIGVMFQHGALFGDLTVLENVSLPLREHTAMSLELIEQVAMLKIALVGLDPDTGALYPNQLSGGMRKRVAVARGIAMDPEVLFLDEPSSGLDPVSANAMDELVLNLQSALGLTVVLVTHDMDSLWRVADRIVLLADAQIIDQGTIRDLQASANTVTRQFFRGPRGRASSAPYQ